MLLKMSAEDKKIYENVGQLKEFILENRRAVMCNVAHMLRILFGSDQMF
jgi:hypothetical protein